MVAVREDIKAISAETSGDPSEALWAVSRQDQRQAVWGCAIATDLPWGASGNWCSYRKHWSFDGGGLHLKLENAWTRNTSCRAYIGSRCSTTWEGAMVIYQSPFPCSVRWATWLETVMETLGDSTLTLLYHLLLTNTYVINLGYLSLTSDLWGKLL